MTQAFTDANGGYYQTEEDGIPSWAIGMTPCEVRNPISPSAQEIIAAKLAQVRATREQVLDRLAGIAGRAHRAGNMELAIACDIAAEELLDITKPPIEDPEQFDAIIIARYAAIVEPYLPTGETPMPELLRAFAAFDE